MRKLSKHVMQLDDGTLHNTVTTMTMPENANEEQLKELCFLAGQEEMAIKSFLEGKWDADRILSIRVVPTWGCNLRCTHCFVHSRLQEQETAALPFDTQSFIDFYGSLKELRKPLRTRFSFIGGEFLLAAKNCIDFMNAVEAAFPGSQEWSGSTNLSLALDETRIELLSYLGDFQVSVDGNKAFHDTQRREIATEDIGPYERTVRNLKTLTDNGLGKSIHVSACMDMDTVSNLQMRSSFFDTMLLIGIPFTNIHWGYAQPINENQTQCLSPIPFPCCAFRPLGFYFIEPPNIILSNYFERVVLGRFSDSVQEIESTHLSYVKAKMPILSDASCMECEYIGLCWGGCYGNHLARIRPSAVCDKSKMKQIWEKKRHEYGKSLRAKCQYHN